MQIEYSKAGFKGERILEDGEKAQKNVLQASVVLIGEKDLAARNAIEVLSTRSFTAFRMTDADFLPIYLSYTPS